MQDEQKSQTAAWLMAELAKGRLSGEEEGWLTLEEVEESLRQTDEGRTEGGSHGACYSI